MRNWKHYLSLFFLTASVLFIASCNGDDDDCPDLPPGCNAGAGGDLTIIATLRHHNVIIPSLANYPDTVFVKFDACELPGTTASAFDRIYIGQAGNDTIRMEGLRCGQYYFFAAAFDTAIQQRVVGGIPYSTEQPTGEISINIPVTEGD